MTEEGKHKETEKEQTDGAAFLAPDQPDGGSETAEPTARQEIDNWEPEGGEEPPTDDGATAEQGGAGEAETVGEQTGQPAGGEEQVDADDEENDEDGSEDDLPAIDEDSVLATPDVPTSREAVTERVVQVIHDFCGISTGSRHIVEPTSLFGDLCILHHQVVKLGDDIADEFGISIGDHESANWTTVGHIVNTVLRKARH